MIDDIPELSGIPEGWENFICGYPPLASSDFTEQVEKDLDKLEEDWNNRVDKKRDDIFRQIFE